MNQFCVSVGRIRVLNSLVAEHKKKEQALFLPFDWCSLRLRDNGSVGAVVTLPGRLFFLITDAMVPVMCRSQKPSQLSFL